MTMKPVQVGDRVPFMNGTRQVLGVAPYTGKYPQWFNCVLKLTSPHTVKGWVEVAYDDLVLRRNPGTTVEPSQPPAPTMPNHAFDNAQTWDLLTALCAKTDLQILEELGPCEGAFQVLEFVQKMRPGMTE